MNQRQHAGRPNRAGTLMLLAALHLAGIGAAPAHAESFATADYLDAGTVASEVDRGARLARVDAFLADARVAEQLVAMGVDPEDAKARVAGLTDAELASLDGRIGQLEAGADLVGVIGVVFVVLIILELTGVTNVFTAF